MAADNRLDQYGMRVQLLSLVIGMPMRATIKWLCRHGQVVLRLHPIWSIGFAGAVQSCMCRRGSGQIPWTVFSNHKVYMFIITVFSP